jgi:glycine/D-amino acid oxidase-like deaminating enzyme
MLPFNGPDQLLKLVGSRYFERITQTSLRSADELFELIEKYQINCQARQSGWIRVDHCDRARKRSQTNANNWNQYGAGMQSVDGKELHRLTGTRAYKTGTLVPKGGAVQPLSLIRGLAKVALKAGTEIYGRSPAQSLSQTSDGWVVKTPQGSIKSSWVILATNGYTDGLLSGLRNSLFPLIPCQIATPPLGDIQIGEILPQGHTISDTRRVIMYARREPDNRIVFGGLGKLTLHNKIAGYDWLVRDAERIYPILKGVDWKFRWGGRIALTGDRLPHFHEPQKGLIAGLGYNGRGVAMAHVMGRILAERVLGADPKSLPFPVTTIKKIPFRGVQLIGKSTALWWMRMLDRIETM